MAKKEYSWNNYRLRGNPAQFIGSVEAPDEATVRTHGSDEVIAGRSDLLVGRVAFERGPTSLRSKAGAIGGVRSRTRSNRGRCSILSSW
jgi:hypothetical protein